MDQVGKNDVAQCAQTCNASELAWLNATAGPARAREVARLQGLQHPHASHPRARPQHPNQTAALSRGAMNGGRRHKAKLRQGT